MIVAGIDPLRLTRSPQSNSSSSRMSSLTDAANQAASHCAQTQSAGALKATWETSGGSKRAA